METVDRFCDTLDLTEHASRIIHALVRTLDNTPELRKTAMDTLTSVAQQLQRRCLIFFPMVNRVCSKHRIQHQRYDMLVNRLSKVYNFTLAFVTLTTMRLCFFNPLKCSGVRWLHFKLFSAIQV